MLEFLLEVLELVLDIIVAAVDGKVWSKKKGNRKNGGSNR